MHRIVPDADNKTPVDVLKQIFLVLAPEIKRQLEQDVVIREKKVYMPRPMLAASDGPILNYREWYRQFYPNDPGASRAVA